jgi:hypothetical protein
MLQRLSPREANRQRQQRWRIRRKQGMVTFRVEANGFRVTDALIASGRLSPDQTRWCKIGPIAGWLTVRNALRAKRQLREYPSHHEILSSAPGPLVENRSNDHMRFAGLDVLEAMIR